LFQRTSRDNRVDPVWPVCSGSAGGADRALLPDRRWGGSYAVREVVVGDGCGDAAISLRAFRAAMLIRLGAFFEGAFAV